MSAAHRKTMAASEWNFTGPSDALTFRHGAGTYSNHLKEIKC